MKFPLGRDLPPAGRYGHDIWQGRFPDRNSEEDGFAVTAPVRTFAPKGYGLFSMTGNVWGDGGQLWIFTRRALALLARPRLTARCGAAARICVMTAVAPAVSCIHAAILQRKARPVILAFG
ncbi:SUMF1/EgtB/PvdO family nonheme iron enzyme [Gemmobacter sp. 24YEA27]|uniref:SUMF1/EgtB/PvdO family nonheme iron enzyme n=1 Tax=Gemmobacter sp. 24YEA27 TaxID=3040672 RepID=UPI0024B356BB|nr:SUMF1/EgtB/PvdO family nonheme iron enzyme [Gemmobacter sp. 24YEA27]